MTEFVSVHVSDEQPGIATLLLSRPPTNALTRQVYREIVGAAADLGRRDDIAVVIVFGGHEIFSAGDDVPELRTLPGGDRRGGRDPEAHRRRHYRLCAGWRDDPGAGRRLAGQR